MGGKEEPHHCGGMFANLLRPADKALAVSLQVCPVVRRHMFLHSAVLVGTAMEPQMGGNTLDGKETLYCGPGKPHIQLLLDVLIRHRIVHVLTLMC